MTALLTRSLVLASSLVLALPQGWCCYVSLMACCVAPSVEKVASAPAKSCCCHAEDSEPATPAVPGPAQPLKSCCCEHVPVVPPVKMFADLDLTVSDLPVPEPSQLAALTTALAAVERIVLPSRPVHVLQCLWLC